MMSNYPPYAMRPADGSAYPPRMTNVIVWLDDYYGAAALSSWPISAHRIAYEFAVTYDGVVFDSSNPFSDAVESFILDNYPAMRAELRP